MYMRYGKQREAGLGSAGKSGVSLKAAREKAAEGRAMLKSGLDPLAEWNKPAAEEGPTFGAAADEYLAAHEGVFRNDKHKAQWRMTLTRYCEPIRKIRQWMQSTRKQCFRSSSRCGRGCRKPPHASEAV
jgi:hypothetical protein